MQALVMFMQMETYYNIRAHALQDGKTDAANVKLNHRHVWVEGLQILLLMTWGIMEYLHYISQVIYNTSLVSKLYYTYGPVGIVWIYVRPGTENTLA